MRQRILDDLVNAMKAKDKDVLSVLRMVKGTIQMEEINKKRELTDEEVLSVLTKQIKTRKESIAEFTKASRQDLIDQTQSEIDILAKYMPKMMDEAEITAVVADIFAELNPSANEIGKVMGRVTSLLKGKADMSLVNQIVKDKLANLK